METALLKVFENPDNWKYLDVVQAHQVTQETWTVIRDLIKYTEHESELDWDNFSTWFCTVAHPSYKADVLDVYRNLFSAVKDCEESYTSEQILEALQEREVATKISEVALSIASGSGTHEIQDIATLLSSYSPRTHDVPTVTDDIDELSKFLTATGLDWRLDCLNQSVGPIGPGDLILLAARPEVGKTSFLASEAAHMVQQIPEDKYVVWFCNEEAGQRVRWRIIQAVTGMTTAEIMADKMKATTEYERLGGKRIKLIDNQEVHFGDIKKILTDLPPGLIVYDQLRNVRGYSKAGTDVERLKHLYREARALAVLAPTMTVHQARGDAEGELWLHQHQLEGSQTEVQGALDVQIMLGRSHDPAYDESLRGLSVVKNKLTGGPKSDPSLRHGKFDVYLDAERSRYGDKP